MNICLLIISFIYKYLIFCSLVFIIKVYLIFEISCEIILTKIFVFSYLKIFNNPNSNEFPLIQSITKRQTPHVLIGDRKISVEIAKTGEEKSGGLSGKKSLGENEGMLFIFEPGSLPSFWMKDMLMPIDIIWISENHIIDIHKDIPAPISDSPSTNLPLYTPSGSIDHVLEVNAGYSDENNIKIGDEVEIMSL